MTDLLKESLTLYTLPVTIVLGLCLFYWLFVLLGALDPHSFHFHVDADAGGMMDGMHGHGGLDGHGGMDAQGGHGAADGHAGPEGVSGGSGGNWFTHLMHYFNVVDVPVMVFLSIAALSIWFLQVNLNAWFNAAGLLLVGFGFLGLSLVAGLFITKAVTDPLKPLFKRLNQGIKSAIELIGSEAVVKSGQVTQAYGQVEVAKDGAPLVLNARIAEGGELLYKGNRVIIYREDPAKGIYYVRKVELENLSLLS